MQTLLTFILGHLSIFKQFLFLAPYFGIQHCDFSLVILKVICHPCFHLLELGTANMLMGEQEDMRKCGQYST